MFGIGITEVLVILSILAVIAFPIWCLVDILRSEFTGNNKIVWLLAVIFVPVIGCIAYVAIGRGQKQ